MDRSWKNNNLLRLTESAEEFDTRFTPAYDGELNPWDYLIHNSDGTYSLDLSSVKKVDRDENIFLGDFLRKNFIKDGRLTVKFKRWDGDFVLSDWGHYTTIKSLEGCPETVKGDFVANRCGLTSLKGAPRVVTGKFCCCGNDLESLEGSPEQVGSYTVTSSRATSFVGSPKIVKGTFHFAGGKGITNLEGVPKKMTSFVFVNGPATIESLEGLPEGVRYVDISHNHFKSLKGCPESVKILNCSHNDITSLEGVPAHMESLDASFNFITTLESGLKTVDHGIWMEGNPLRELGNTLESVGRHIRVDEDAKLSRLRRLAKDRGIRVTFSSRTSVNPSHDTKMKELGYYDDPHIGRSRYIHK
jgi:hypothetical protein